MYKIEMLLEWMEHVRSLQAFPRDFGVVENSVFKRYKIFTKEKYYAILNDLWDKYDCYISLFSDYQLEHRLYDAMFLETKDWSLEEFDKIVENAKEIAEILDSNNIKYKTIFSGARSVHFYIMFEPMKIMNYSNVCRKIVKHLKLTKLVDRHVIGNKRQMVRIPCSLNTKTMLFSLPINIKNFNKKDIIKLQFPRVSINMNNSNFIELIKTYDTKRPDEVFKDYTGGITNLESYPDCVIKEIIELNETGHLSHESRFNLAAFLLGIEMPFEMVVKIFSKAKDFDPDKTEYQLNSIMNKYVPFGCFRIKDIGDCPYENQRNCIFYPSIYKSLNNYFGGFKNDSLS